MLFAGEIVDDVVDRTIKIQRILQFWRIERKFVFSDPKTAKSEREIPMTDECIRILKLRKDVKNTITNLAFKDLVFYNQEGLPTKSSTYDSAIIIIVNRMDDMEKFSMHTFRHTFATRCIEAGMKPKTLQSILGHSSISITMDLYVHTTDEEKHTEIQKLFLLA